MISKLRILLVTGARPNYMKIAPIWRELRRDPARFDPVLVHTGQHYDEAMFDIFFRELGMDPPNHFLHVGSASHAVQTGNIMIKMEAVVQEVRPDLVVVVGDVNSTLAASLVAAKKLIPVAHIEAGLRSFDRTMPEEINRILTDAISAPLFTTCREADENLKREGVAPEEIHFVGNTMIDSLEALLPTISERAACHTLGLEPGSYVAVTLHRPSNVDDAARLDAIMKALADVARETDIIFPAHPRTTKALKALGWQSGAERLKIVEPMGYFDFTSLMLTAGAVLTDSGGIQEETSYLGIPCLTLRPNTERPITITEGTNKLVDLPAEQLASNMRTALRGAGSVRPKIELWDGRASERIAEVLRHHR